MNGQRGPAFCGIRLCMSHMDDSPGYLPMRIYLSQIALSIGPHVGLSSFVFRREFIGEL